MTTPNGALAQILAAAGWDAADAEAVTFTGADPVLPANFMMATAGAAAIAASGLAAARLWRARSGVDQQVSVDLRAAGVAMKSNKLMTVDDRPVSNDWLGISGFYETGDGHWVQFHCNYPHHRDGVLAVLGCADDPAAVAAAVADRSAAQLEDVLTGNGMPVAMVRDGAAWADHAQSAAVAALPLLDIQRIGEAPREPLPVPEPGSDRPLAGIRALDLTRVLAGPVAGRTLAEHGAQVLTINGPHLPYIEEQVMDTGHGKLSAHLDLRSPRGRDKLKALIAEADIFTQAYRPGALAGRGFSPEEAVALRPGLIYVDISAWSHVGPWAPRRGFDSLVQSASGLAHEHGRDGTPHHLPGQALDYVTGYLGAFGAMTALAHRAREGGSWLVRLALARSAHWMNGLGRVDGGDARTIANPGLHDIGDLLQESATPWGRLTHMAPVAQLAATPGRWDHPTVPPGTHPPTWTQ